MLSVVAVLADRNRLSAVAVLPILAVVSCCILLVLLRPADWRLGSVPLTATLLDMLATGLLLVRLPRRVESANLIRRAKEFHSALMRPPSVGQVFPSSTYDPFPLGDAALRCFNPPQEASRELPDDCLITAEELGESAIVTVDEWHDLAPLFGLAAQPVQGSLAMARFLDLTLGYVVWMLVGPFAIGQTLATRSPRIQQARNELAACLASTMKSAAGEISHSVYLRSFDITGRFGLQAPRSAALSHLDTELEGLLADVFWSFNSCFIAVGQPRDDFGAGHLPAPDANWQEHVDALVAYGDFIVLVPATSTGVAWELRLLARRELWDRVLFVMPWQQPELMNPEFWARTRDECAELGLKLPEYDSRGAMFVRVKDGSLQVQRNLRGLAENVGAFKAAVLDLLARTLEH